VFLLRFLRAKKYSILKATQALENYLLSPRICPNYYKSLDVLDPTLSALYDTGCFLLSPGRDADGCRFVVERPAVIDAEKFTFLDWIRAAFLLAECGLDNEETQISGIKFLLDYSGIQLNFLGMISFTDIKNFLEIVMSSMAYRIKAIYLLNMPSIVVHIHEFAMKFVSKKLKKRIILVKDVSELKNYMADVSLLPEEYGGKFSIEDSLKFTKEYLLENRQSVLLLNEMDVDLVDRGAAKSDGSLGFGAEGSFRKLEID
jgi:hypothetical protein